jgi:hypothetical protein
MSNRKTEEFVYGSTLEAITKGLYPDKRHALREFIQNSFDASRQLMQSVSNCQARPIEVRLERPSIVIYDEGIGMTATQMRQYRYAGYSEKKRGQTVGFRGIGKLSGVAIAKQIIVTSSRIGDAKRYEVVIEAEKMFEDLSVDKNKPLNALLKARSMVKESREKPDAHYTMVELREVREDSLSLFDESDIRSYLSRTVAVPHDPAFDHGEEVNRVLMQQVTDYFQCNVLLNGQPIFKPYPKSVRSPQFMPIFRDNTGTDLLAYVWYCQNSEGGQIKDDEPRGLVYRMKNFAVGDEWQSRKDLWKAGTQNRAFHFFGEIHVCDNEMIPTADRTNFEDNSARQALYQRFQPVYQRLNREAETESAQRRFDVTLKETQELLAMRSEQAHQGTLDVSVKADVEFQIRKRLEDVEKRLSRAQRTKDPAPKYKALIRQGRKVRRSAQKLLGQLRDKEDRLYDVTKAVPMSEESKRVYNITVDVLREELKSSPAVFEKLIQKLRQRIAEAFA